MDKPTISTIVAMSSNDRAIGKHNRLLWRIPLDTKHFKEITSGHPVIMGRKTWESIPEKYRPLPDRDNIVITRDKDYKAEGAIIQSSLEEGIKYAQALNSNEIFIMGGASIYEQALPLTQKLYITLVEGDFDGDTFFPDYSEFNKEIFREEHKKNDPPFTFITLER